MSVSLRLAALVWVAAALSATPSAEAQFAPPWPPPPPPSPPPRALPLIPRRSHPAPRDGVRTPTVRILGNATGNEAAVTVSNCCQWYKWCDNTAVQYQCHAALLTDCGAIGARVLERQLLGVHDVPGLGGDPGRDARQVLPAHHPRLPGVHRYPPHGPDPASDRRPGPRPERGQGATGCARLPRHPASPQLVVCKALNYKCLKQRSATKAGNPCEVIPGVKIPGMRTPRSFSACTTARRRTRGGAGGGAAAPRRRHNGIRRGQGRGAVADMHDRGNSTHTGFAYPHGITKFDGNGTSPAYNASAVGVAQYSPTSDPVGR